MISTSFSKLTGEPICANNFASSVAPARAVRTLPLSLSRPDHACKHRGQQWAAMGSNGHGAQVMGAGLQHTNGPVAADVHGCEGLGIVLEGSLQ